MSSLKTEVKSQSSTHALMGVMDTHDGARRSTKLKAVVK
jgi:hypothetical protein